jgi:hypothetical protein
MADRRDRDDDARKTPMQHRTWTDEELLQVLTAQDYITRCELGTPEFIGLTPFVDDWWEARVRHAVAKEPERIARARERLIQMARKIEQTKIEWAEGPQNEGVRERLLAASRASRVIPLNRPPRARRDETPPRRPRRG